MDEGEGVGGHEQVVTSLLDLQARLRGEERPSPPEAPPEPDERSEADEVVVLPHVEDGSQVPRSSDEPPPTEDTPEVQVLTTPDPDEAEERPGFAPVTALHTGAAAEDRLADRVSGLEGSIASVEAMAEEREQERSDRMVALEQRLLHEVASQRRELIQAIDDRFAQLDASLREGLAELHLEPASAPEPDEPA
jgi:hypothetical protein